MLPFTIFSKLIKSVIKKKLSILLDTNRNSRILQFIISQYYLFNISQQIAINQKDLKKD